MDRTREIYFERPFEPTVDGWADDDTFVENTDNSFDENFEDDPKLSVLTDEAKTLAPEIVEVFKKSGSRLNEQQELIKGVPNSIVFYTALGLIVILGAKILSK